MCAFQYAVQSVVLVVEDVDEKQEEDGKNSTQFAKFEEHGVDSSNYFKNICSWAHCTYYIPPGNKRSPRSTLRRTRRLGPPRRMLRGGSTQGDIGK